MFGFSQENIECSFESVSTSPDPVVAVFDRAAQGVVRIYIFHQFYQLHYKHKSVCKPSRSIATLPGLVYE